MGKSREGERERTAKATAAAPAVEQAAGRIGDLSRQPLWTTGVAHPAAPRTKMAQATEGKRGWGGALQHPSVAREETPLAATGWLTQRWSWSSSSFSSLDQGRATERP